MGRQAGTLVEVAIGDEPVDWRSIGFSVGDDGVCQVGAVRIRLIGSDTSTGAGGAPERGRGIVGWTLAGCTVTGGGVDGLPTADAGPEGTVVSSADLVAQQPVRHAEPDADAEPPLAHPNGVTQIDHLVVITPDLERTTAAIEATGVVARRTREAGRGRRQRFFRLGEVILEVVGPVEPAGHGPATFWGLAFTVADIDATTRHLAGRIGEPGQAVQQGRRIATLRSGDEVSVPVAFMSGDGPGTPGRADDTSL
jgi:hypothetical protein